MIHFGQNTADCSYVAAVSVFGFIFRRDLRMKTWKDGFNNSLSLGGVFG